MVHCISLCMQQVRMLEYTLMHTGHPMSNQHKKYLTLMDLDETWLLHSVC